MCAYVCVKTHTKKSFMAWGIIKTDKFLRLPVEPTAERVTIGAQHFKQNASNVYRVSVYIIYSSSAPLALIPGRAQWSLLYWVTENDGRSVRRRRWRFIQRRFLLCFRWNVSAEKKKNIKCQMWSDYNLPKQGDCDNKNSKENQTVAPKVNRMRAHRLRKHWKWI